MPGENKKVVEAIKNSPQQQPEAVEESPKIIVLTTPGEFGWDGKLYHHDHLDLETAKWLIQQGYPYLQIK